MIEPSPLYLLLHWLHDKIGHHVGVIGLVSVPDFQIFHDKPTSPWLSLQVKHGVTQAITIFLSLCVLTSKLMSLINHFLLIIVKFRQEAFTMVLLGLLLTTGLHFKILMFRWGEWIKVPSGHKDNRSTVSPLGSMAAEWSFYFTLAAFLLLGFEQFLCGNVTIIQTGTRRCKVLYPTIDRRHPQGISVESGRADIQYIKKKEKKRRKQ